MKQMRTDRGQTEQKQTGRNRIGSLGKRLASLLAALFLLTGTAPAVSFASGSPSVSAEAVVLADLDSGLVLYEKNMNVRRSPASLTKIMTGLLAVEAVENGEVSLDDVITAPADCWTGMDLDSSNAEILPGEKMTFKDYLYCALVKSANEACNVIAAAIDGDIQAFVNRMNLRANELGATGTYFSDTNGLSSSNHYTTAHDLFLITREAMKHEIFVEAVNTIDYEIEETNMHAKRYLNSSNALLCQDGAYGDGYLYLPASGVKTGYTKAAGYCLVSTASKNDMNLCAVVLGCGGVLNTGEDGYGNFSATVSLYEWAFSNCEKRTLVEKGTVVNRAPVTYALDNATAELRASGELEAVLPKGYDGSRITTSILLRNDSLTAPVSAGSVLGTLSVYLDGSLYGEIDLYTSEEVAADRKKILLHTVSELMENPRIRIPVIISAVLIVLILFLLGRYSVEKQRHYREIVEAEDRRRTERARQEAAEESLLAQQRMREARKNAELPDEDSP